MAYEPTLDEVLNSIYGPDTDLTEEELAQYLPEPYAAPQYTPQGIPVPQGRAQTPASFQQEAPRGRVKTTVNKNLSPEARALLDTIAGDESPDYRTVYGGRKVNDLSWHPGIAVPIRSGPNAGQTSSAAGRYQFLGSTWNNQAKKLGLSDFSPESQDLAAWNLALESYGPSLEADLRSGDPAKIARVGHALRKVWTSLPGGIEQGAQASKFASRYFSNLGAESGSPQETPQTAPQESPYQTVKLSDGTTVDVEPGADLSKLAEVLKTNGIDAEPLRQVALPDGSYVDAPLSYSDEQVLQGMRKLAPDAFGEQPVAESDKKGYSAAAKSAFESSIGDVLGGLGGLGTYAGQKLESPLAQQAGQYLTEKGKEWQEMGQEAYEELTPEEAKALGLGGQFRKYIGEPLASFGGSALATIPALAAPGGIPARIGMFVTQELGGQLAEQERMGQPQDVEKALPYAAVSGVVQTSLLGPLKYVNKAFGRPEVAAELKKIVAEKGEDAAKDYAGGVIKNVLKEVGVNTGEVVTSEIISRAAARAASSQDLASPEALREYTDTAIKSAPGGLLGIPAGMGVHAAKQGTIEEAQLAQKQQELEAARVAAAEEAQVVESKEAQRQAAEIAELERKAGIGVEVKPSEEPSVAPVAPPVDTIIPPVESQEPPAQPVAPTEELPAAPVAPSDIAAAPVEVAPEEVQAELPAVETIPEPTIRQPEPKHWAEDMLGLPAKAGLVKKLKAQNLNIDNPADHEAITDIISKTQAKIEPQNYQRLEAYMDQVAAKTQPPIPTPEVPSAQRVEIPEPPDARSSGEPEIRQEGGDQTISGEGVLPSDQIDQISTRAGKTPEVEIPEAKLPQPEAVEVETPEPVEKIQTPAEAWESLRTPDQPAFASLSKNTQDLWKKEYKENEGIVSKDAVADYVKAEQPKRLLVKGEAPKEIEVEGVKRPTTDSTGAPIHTTEEGVKNFWKGFKGTKAVDEQGRPLRVLHGTHNDVKKFTPEAIGSETDQGFYGPGYYFTPDARAASVYATNRDYIKDEVRPGGNVMPVYLDIKNPYYTTAEVLSDAEVARIKKAGHDGVIATPDIAPGYTEYVVFSPEQIKSAIGNKGEFDVSKPDIRESKGEPAVANPHTKETIQSELKKIYGENAPQIEVSDRATENVDAATKGFFEPSTGRAVLVADNIGRGEDLHGLLRHEVAVHAKKLGKSDKEFQDILKQVDRLKAQGAKDVVDAFDRVPKDTKPEDVSHEALAYLVQNKPKLPIVKRFMSWLRRTANKITGNAEWLRGDDFAVMADDVLKKAGKKAPVKPTKGERLLAKEPTKPKPLVKETEPKERSILRDGMDAAADVIKSGFWTRLETSLVDKNATLREKIKDKSTFDADGKLRADLVGSANDQIFNTVTAGITEGIPVFSTDGTVMIRKDQKKNLSNITKVIDKLKIKTPRAYVGFIARALRGESILKEDAETMKRIDELRGKAKKLNEYAKTQSFAEGKAASDLAEKYTKQADKLQSKLGEEGREKLVTADDIAEAKRRLAEHPEIQPILDDIHGLLKSLVDLWEEGGLINKEVANKWKSDPYYIPLYASTEDLLSDPSKTVRMMGGGAKSLPNVKALKGGEQAINLLENLQRHYAFMTTAAAQNATRKAAARDMELFGAARPTSRDDKQAIMFKEDGKEIYYHIDDPVAFDAFQTAAPLMNPLLKAARGYTKAFRAVTLVNPLYWYRQLIRDPLHANVVSKTGIVTPIGATLSFAKIIAGASKEYGELKRRGVVGAVDSLSDPTRFKKISDKNPGLFKKGADWVMHVHEAADAATRVEVYKAALKEAKKKGMSREDAKNYATMRAREIINFANQGRSETLQAIRATVPFFSAALNSLDSVARAATGKGLNRREAAEARRLFVSRALMIASYTTAYALAMQDDEDYLNSPDSVNNWLIPTGKKDSPFVMIPIPFELGFFTKILPELMVRLNSGTLRPSEAKKMAKEAAWSTLTPPLPFPQLIKPLAEAATNTDFHTGRAIVGAGQARLTPTEQTRGASSLSIELGRELGISPIQIEHFGRGYLTELWTVTGLAADKFLEEGQSKPEKYAGEVPIVMGGAKGILTKPERDRHMDTFFELNKDIGEMHDTVTRAQGRGDVDTMNRLMADPEAKKKFYAAPAGRKIAEEISKVEKAIDQIQNDKSLTPERKQIAIREKTKWKNTLATQGVQQLNSLGIDLE